MTVVNRVINGWWLEEPHIVVVLNNGGLELKEFLEMKTGDVLLTHPTNDSALAIKAKQALEMLVGHGIMPRGLLL